MSRSSEAVTHEAKWGERMIEVKVRFFTDGIVEKGKVRPKNAWGRGVVGMDRNKAHEIIPLGGLPFNFLLELPMVIEKVLIQHGITIHLSGRMSKYLVSKGI